MVAVIQSLVLALSLSIDVFIAGLSCGADRVRIPFVSALLVAGVSSVALASSMLLGRALGGVIPERAAEVPGALLLFGIGALKLFDSSLKAFIRRHPRSRRRISFSLFSLRLILEVYADPEKADRDCSRVLSPREAASLAAALSLDCIAAGLGAGIASMGWVLPFFLSLAMGVCAMEWGSWIGRRLAGRLSLDWLGGVLLMGLAASKLI